ncbi:50S ribosomal protein L11 methyltransferase [methane-oxidizing endosymbiont of Gigantopelta aegis]|uniref:50S ribosomal protein L11 methyltransferase n=1 Tax=methane-oxidizing endosymbiont of Gigantopelta aegis TaxID=2794938 RepID=UPI0018DCA9A0|nr:50S ribosomal protein L11 methyltransferase [methane-oxidizing endosymbiont of Gigantopelta aegis]
MAWHQLSVTSDKETAPKLSDFFSDCGAVSVTYMDAEDQPVYEPAPGETRIWRKTRVIALFELDIEPERVKQIAQQQFVDSPLNDWTLERIEDQAWERAWLEHFKPLKFGDRLWVCPTGQEIEETGTVCMTLDPGLAFGTGTHPTTALCLEWLACHDLTGKTIIDYGCGSGILAVAAVLLGAKQAHCIDIDPQALEATYYNAEKNQVTHAIQCYLPEQFPAQKADIVLANILAGPLIELSENIAKLVSDKGSLVLSGILNEQADTVIQAYQQQGLHFSTPRPQEDWCRLDGYYVHPMSRM